MLWGKFVYNNNIATMLFIKNYILQSRMLNKNIYKYNINNGA